MEAERSQKQIIPASSNVMNNIIEKFVMNYIGSFAKQGAGRDQQVRDWM
jgi:hypothetical protein